MLGRGVRVVFCRGASHERAARLPRRLGWRRTMTAGDVACSRTVGLEASDRDPTILTGAPAGGTANDRGALVWNVA